MLRIDITHSFMQEETYAVILYRPMLSSMNQDLSIELLIDELINGNKDYEARNYCLPILQQIFPNPNPLDQNLNRYDCLI